MTCAFRTLKIAMIAAFLLLSTIMMQIPVVSALIPSVSLTTTISGDQTTLNISITHNAPPTLSASHYVTVAEITITNASGLHIINLTTAAAQLPAAPQTPTFYVNYSLGNVTTSTSVSVRVNCNVHGWSGVATLSIGDVPTAPTGLTATAGDGYVRLSWTAPASAGSTPVTNYTLYRGTSAASLTAYKTLGAVTTYNDTSVTNNNTYYYKVSASNSWGEGPSTAQASAMPAPGGGTPPTAPGDSTLLTVGVVAVILALIMIAAIMMRRRGGSKKEE